MRGGSWGAHGRWWLAASAAAVLAAAVVIAVGITRARHTDDQTADGLRKPPATVAIGAQSPLPWPAPADATAAVHAAGLPMLGAEGAVEHIHAHLDVLVDGTPVPVPAFIGIDRTRATISPLHTHDTTGVVHIESPVQRSFTLGEFFTEWGVSMAADHLGALRSGDGKTLQLYVNGTAQQGNPAAVVIHPHDEITLVYGAPESGTPVPSHYEFPPGE
jgi:hypothetical protein